MFSIGFLELLIVATVALLVLGPDRLPGAVRETSLWIRTIRRQFSTLRRDLEEQLEDVQNDQMFADFTQGRKLLDQAQRDIGAGLGTTSDSKNPQSSEDQKT